MPQACHVCLICKTTDLSVASENYSSRTSDNWILHKETCKENFVSTGWSSSEQITPNESARELLHKLSAEAFNIVALTLVYLKGWKNI